jgi:hypothetical protein
MDGALRDEGDVFLLDLPAGGIMRQEDFFFLCIQLAFSFQKNLLYFFNLLDTLMEPHVALSCVLEEGVEVDLEQIDFVLHVVAPFDHHVVELYVDFVEVVDVVVFCCRVETFAGFVQFCKLVAELVELIYLVDSLGLETLAGSGYFFV